MLLIQLNQQPDRIKIYVNGEQVTSWGSATYPNQNTDWYVNNNTSQYIGAYNFNDAVLSDKFDGTLSQVYLIDGLALGPGYFGFTDPLTGTWRPKKFEAKGTTVNDGRTFSSIGTFTNWDDDGSYPKTELFDGTLYSGGTPNGAVLMMVTLQVLTLEIKELQVSKIYRLISSPHQTR